MSRDKLKHSLDALHEALEQADSIDAGTRQRLRGVMDDIRAALERDDETEQERSDSWTERLQSSIGEFEGEHPTLAKGLAELIAALHNMGF